MRKHCFLLSLIAIALTWTACQSDAPTITVHDSVELDNSDMQLSIEDDGTRVLSFKASDEWTISVIDTSGLDWCSVSPMNGQGGDVTVSISAQPNMLDDRAVKILINVLGTQVPVEIFQEFGNGVEDIPIPDKNLRKFLINSYYYDTDRNGKISYREVKNITELLIQSRQIKSLQGIEYFKSLKKLDLCDNEVSHINIDRNTKLQYLCCDNNEVSSLDLSNCEKLKEIVCSYNKLTELDLSKQQMLTRLDCSRNSLMVLDVSNNTELNYLNCDDNNIKTLDVSKNLKLKYLSCSGYDMSEVWISENQKDMGIYKRYETEIKYK